MRKKKTTDMMKETKKQKMKNLKKKKNDLNMKNIIQKVKCNKENSIMMRK